MGAGARLGLLQGDQMTVPDEIERLRAERDEARKLVIESIYKGTASKRDIANARGWTGLYPDDDYDMEGDVE